MDIFYIITRANQGGAQVNVLSLARAAAAQGHAVRVAVGDSGWLTEQAAAYGVKTVVLPGLRRSSNPLLLPRFASALRRELKREPADIMHLHSSNTLFGVLATLWLGRRKPKIVATVHGLSVLNPGWRGSSAVRLVYATVMRLLWSRCDRLIFVCQSDFDFVTVRRWVKADKGAVIRNGIGGDIAFLGRGRAREELGLAEDDRRLVVGTVARLGYQKDIDLLLRVAESVRDQDFVFRVVGDGPDRSRLQEQIDKNGLADTVRIHLRFKDGYKYLQGFDLFLMTSRYEGLPYTLLEAGLAGLPTVAIAVDGVSEVIQDGETGLLVGERDAETLANALKCLMDNPVRRKGMGDAARQQIKTEFSERKMIERTFALYERAILAR